MKKITFKMKELFDASNDGDILTICCMAAINDLSTAFGEQIKYLTKVNKRKNVSANKKLYHEALHVYYFRLGCSHALECLKALALLRKNSKFNEFLSQAGTEILKQFRLLKDIEKSDIYNSMMRIRNGATFHYINGKRVNKEIELSLKGFPDNAEGTILLGKTNKDTRYLIADDILSNTTRLHISNDNTEKIFKGMGFVHAAILHVLGNYITWFIGNKKGFVLKKAVSKPNVDESFVLVNRGVRLN